MSNPNDITQLSKIVSDGSQVIRDHFGQLGANLSFDVGDPDPALLALSSPPEYEEARVAVINAATRLVDLLCGNEGRIFGFWSEQTAIAALCVAMKYRFPQAIPETNSIAYTEIAQTVGLDEDTTRRVIEVLIVYNIFRKTGPDCVAHNRISHGLAFDEGWNSSAEIIFEESLTATCHLSDALQQWGPPKTTNRLGLNVATSSDQTLWEYLEGNQDRRAHFARFMRRFATSKLGDVDCVLRGVDWGAFGDCTVIDVGGSLGHVSMRIAEKHPGIRFTVQDFDAVCRQGEQNLPDRFKGRISFQRHNFFDPQPQPQPATPDGTVVFLLKSIIHDWSDEDACKVFRGIAPVLKRGDRIVLLEHILPEPREGAPPLERLGRTRDLTMMALLNGKERTAADFHSLVKQADPRLGVVQTASFEDLLMGVVVIALDA